MQRNILVIALIGIVDAMSFMIIAPSIVFYVRDLGGDKHWYGVILSSYSFAAFCTKPLLGHWSDVSGFRIPYLFTMSMAMLGGILYLTASAFQGTMALIIMLASRILAGVGGGNSALGFAYIARMLLPKERTSITTILSSVRSLLMTVSPAINFALANVHADFFSGKFVLDPLNSVGLVIAIGNTISILAIFFILEEAPPHNVTNHSENEVGQGENTTDLSSHSTESTTDKVSLGSIFWEMVSYPQVWVPFLTIYVINASFQLIETALAPAANDALGWGPVKISSVYSFISVFMVIFTMTSLALSSKGMHDITMLKIGLVTQAIGFGLMYFLWTKGAESWQFIVPTIIAVCSFPFLGAPNRSLFSAAVDMNPSLAAHTGMMQALLGMGASVAGFTAPGLIASFVLQTPEQVQSSKNGRELGPLALLAPIFAVVCFIAVMWAGEPEILAEKREKKKSIGAEDKGTPKETTPLVCVNQRRKSKCKYHYEKLNHLNEDHHSFSSRSCSTSVISLTFPHHDDKND